MKDYVISEIRVETGDMAFLSGGPVVSEIKLSPESGPAFYLSLCEMDGYPTIYRSAKSTIDSQIDPDTEEEFFEKIGDNCIFSGEYEELLRNTDDELFKAYRYLTYLTRCENDDVEPFIEKTSGKKLSEVVIPASDIEEDMELDDLQ